MAISRSGRNFFKRGKMENDVNVAYTLLSEHTAFHVKEAYKAMRTNVMFFVPNEGCKVIGVTSAVPSEGKSTTVLNLSITFAETGTKVLLIDADMRRPNIKKILNSGEGAGLSDVLARFVKAKEVIRPSGYENLDVIFSGNIPPNPVELLASDTMKDMIEELKAEYDYIFIDTPPINVVTDATVVSRLLHGIILIARENVSRKDEVAEAMNKLQFVNAKILGLVLNDKMYQSKRRGRYGKYKHYYNYKKYGEDD
jgi:capsular exopolysaccharide synthesis family protein